MTKFERKQLTGCLPMAIVCALLAACGGPPTPGPVTLDELFCQDLSGLTFEGPAGEEMGHLEAYGRLANNGGPVQVDAVQVEIVDGNGTVVDRETLGVSMEVESGSRFFNLGFDGSPGTEGGSCRVRFLSDGAEVASATVEIDRANRGF